ncbi:MAG: type II toxin-antitoxin system VapC family toxin [Gaiellaceae bacterium]
MAAERPDLFLLDTSYRGQTLRNERNGVAPWPEEVIERISAGIQAISVMTVAEERSGEISGNWSRQRRQESDKLRRALLWIPLDEAIVDRWAALTAECRTVGLTGPGDNDCWIAATAIERDAVLVTCDVQQSRLPGLCDPIYLVPV